MEHPYYMHRIVNDAAASRGWRIENPPESVVKALSGTTFEVSYTVRAANAQGYSYLQWKVVR